MCRRETTRAPAVQKHWQESQYPWQSVSLPTFSQSSSLCLPLVFSVHRKKERQTHFHTNGVRACSPETQWNCKYFIFAWEPRAITPQLLSLLFHSFLFFYFLSILCSPAYSPPLSTFYADPLYCHLSFCILNLLSTSLLTKNIDFVQY